MRASGIKPLLAAALLTCGQVSLFCVQASAAEHLVRNQAEYAKVAKTLEAGDTVVLANGVWRDFEILFTGEGEKEHPITLTAEEKGKVFLSGQSNLRLAGEHLVVSGLVFKDGYTPSSEVVSFRRNKEHLASHSRVTEIVIEDFSKPERMESDYWVSLYGKNNRFDHSHLSGKRNKGVTMAVRLNSEESQENRHRIDHNYFGPRPVLGSNGGETLRIGTSHYSLTDSLTVVENNFFDRCDGEVEIISVKSGKNILRNNTFFESRGTLTLRHGNGNLIEGNVFLGNGVDHTGGIRVINADQTVRNNYLEGLTGYRFGSGFTVMNGVPNSPINRYHQVVNAKIENNSFIDVDHIHLAAGSDQERSAVPQDSIISSNIFYTESGKSPFSVFDDISGITFANNVSSGFVDKKIQSGIAVKVGRLERADNGLLYPKDKVVAGKGANKSLMVASKDMTGVSWYPKSEPVTPFGSGKTTDVTPGEDALFDAIQSAADGDTLLLESGDYSATKRLDIKKTLTIKAKKRGGVTLTSERPVMFEIQDGGSLSLDGLVISGANSPDNAGNTLIRTAVWGMLKNYRFSMTNSRVENLDINHSYHFFDSGIRAFADRITLHNNHFENITGDLLKLNKEKDDLGIYNAEYVTVTGNTFKKVQGALVDLYRGGTDESTFGPHIDFSKNTVTESGTGKRNKAQALIKLHGVQVASVYENRIDNSAGIVVEHTVGEPVTRVASNQFIRTALPEVKELVAEGPHTAVLANNDLKN
ncbi:chondroitinase-B domain-containing protein [Microbulbifer bruguierae]|uniref:Chondroitinase-B domain-containing protein n=1 Tax=Microbulbifer bruguierae TaxID=3029061 RepID=A0ABY8NBJ6_9GAMM|nr:chondroitinase-B domain-containing protein [Microbulbifer bruguierae]WGL16168.1 chondroitinase-B domain-containing protein [Microbulbifer bruguierae]